MEEQNVIGGNIKAFLLKHLWKIVTGNLMLFGILLFIFIVIVTISAMAVQQKQGENPIEPPDTGEILERYKQSPLLPPYTITEEYGYYTGELSGGHYGTDMSGGYGAKILSVLDGTVTHIVDFCVVGFPSCGGNYGNYITLQHTLESGQVIYTRYAHLHQVNVSVGQSVVAGEVIGLQGNSGFSTGTHLHFEVRVQDGYVRTDTRNPRDYFEF